MIFFHSEHFFFFFATIYRKNWSYLSKLLHWPQSCEALCAGVFLNPGSSSTYSWVKIPLMLGKIEGKRRRGRPRMRWLDRIADSMDMSISTLQEIVKDSRVWGAIAHEVIKSQTRLNDWTTTSRKIYIQTLPGRVQLKIQPQKLYNIIISSKS